ncbi:MAG: sarcosine oxidase subunit delta [Methanobrevibacter sp.]|jgi:transposase-like protein|nr:sarcosine oxidase subunit delta [Candidatus Methanovirga australis]
MVKKEVCTCPYCGVEDIREFGAGYLNKDGLYVNDFKCRQCERFILASKVIEKV